MRDRLPEPLNDVDRAFLARHAPSALARRGAPFFLRQRLVWGDWIVTGIVGLVGLHALGWSATTAAFVLIAGFWLGWLGDVAFVLARGRALAAAIADAADDDYLWALVGVLRGQRRSAAGYGRGGPGMGVSIVVDLVAGAAATLLAWRGFAEAGVDVEATLRSADFLSASAILFATGVLPLFVSRLTARVEVLEPPVFRVGQRGIGLVVFVFALMAAGGGTLAPKVMMTVAFAFLLLMGLVQLAFDLPHRQRAAAWLREQRAEAAAAP